MADVFTELQEMKNRRAALLAQTRAILDKCVSEKRAKTAGETEEFNKVHAEIDSLGTMIEDKDRQVEAERSIDMPGAKRTEKHADPAKSAEWRDRNGAAVPVLSKEQRLADVYREPNGDTLSVGKAILGMVTGRWAGADAERRAMGGGSMTAGGFFLSPALSSMLIDLARNQAVVMQAGALTVPMDTSELAIAKVTADPSADWVGENVAATESEPTLGRVTLRAKKVVVLTSCSRELLQDAPNASQVLEQILGAAIAVEIDRAALLGIGSEEEPLGVFNSGCGTAAISGAIDFDDVTTGMAHIFSHNHVPRTFIYNPDTWKRLTQLKTGDGTYFNQAPIGFADLQRLVTCQLATTQAVVGDFERLVVGVRAQIEFEVGLLSTSFAKNQLAIRAIWRGDVAVTQPEAFYSLTAINNS